MTYLVNHDVYTPLASVGNRNIGISGATIFKVVNKNYY